MDFRDFAKEHPARIALCEPDERIVRAARILADQGLCTPVFVGEREAFSECGVPVGDIDVIPIAPERFAQEYVDVRKHKGISLEDAVKTVADPAFFSVLLARSGEVDGVVAGATWPTANTIRPALHVLRGGFASSSFVMKTSLSDFVFADCAFNIQPNPEELAQIAFNAGLLAEQLGWSPRIAMLSFSTVGSASHPDQEKVAQATAYLKQLLSEQHRNWTAYGEVQLDAAIIPAVGKQKGTGGDANVLVFPNLDAGNIGYKLVSRFANAESVGPIMTGFSRPVNDLSRGCTVDEIIDVCCVTAWQAHQ